MRFLLFFFILLFCIGCSSSPKKAEYETNLLKAKVLRITERMQVMISMSGVYSEDKKMIIDSIIGYIETKTIYNESGKATLYYTGAAEGLVPHSLHPKEGYLPFDERYSKYKCNINVSENYIIDIAEPKPDRFEFEQSLDFVTDTIKKFVIIQKDKIILSRADYELLQKSKDGSKDNIRYILYHYE